MMLSKNGIALIIILAEAILSSLGIEFEAGSVEKVVEGVVVGAGLLLAVWNQIDRADVRNFIFKE